jgi:Cu2+-exporting ATPase
MSRASTADVPCRHCGTPCPTGLPHGDFCCAGCGFVHSLIHEQGLDQFYAIRGGARNGPVGTRVFEPRDFAWLERRAAAAEVSILKELRD